MSEIVNKASWSSGGRPTEDEIALSEIRMERRLGHWKRANDLRRHLERQRRKRGLDWLCYAISSDGQPHFVERYGETD